MANIGDRTLVIADDPRIQYVGRIGVDEMAGPSFHYGGSNFRTRFSGTSLALGFQEDDWGGGNWIGVRIDGSPEIKFRLKPKSDQLLQVAVGLDDRTHDLEVYRRSDCFDGSFIFKGLALDRGKSLSGPPPLPRRRIEFFGDSVTAGALCEAVGYEDRKDDEIATEHLASALTNPYWSFAADTARALHAEAHIEGIGGLAVNDGNGWWGGDHPIGFESTFDKLDPIPGRFKPWDFSRWTPQVVVVAIAQNDARSMRPDVKADRHKWASTYRRILQRLQAHYPNAWYVLTTTIHDHDRRWDDLLDQMALDYRKDLKQLKVVTYRYRRVGVGTPGHLRIKEHREMANELVAFIESLPRVWRDR